MRGPLLGLLLADVLAELLEHPLDLGPVRRAPALLVAEHLPDRDTTEAVVQHLEMVGRHQRGMNDSAGSGERVQLAAQRDDVPGPPLRLVARPDRPLEPLALGRDAHRAAAGVADLRLDTADREHRLPRYVHHVASEG